MPRAATLDGTVFVAATRTLYIGRLVATERHAHHATQVIVAPEGISVGDGDAPPTRAHAVVIPPRVPHAHGPCDHAALLYLDGDDAVSRELSRDTERRRSDSWRRDELSMNVPCTPTPAQARAFIKSVLSVLDVLPPPPPRHPATRRMCALLDRTGDVDLARLSRAAGLSPRQMRYTFARDVGLPMRAYLRWRRLRHALLAIEDGASLGAAAISAGFADSAHLTRACREHFGMTPSQGLRNVRWRTLD